MPSFDASMCFHQLIVLPACCIVAIVLLPTELLRLTPGHSCWVSKADRASQHQVQLAWTSGRWWRSHCQGHHASHWLSTFCAPRHPHRWQNSKQYGLLTRQQAQSTPIDLKGGSGLPQSAKLVHPEHFCVACLQRCSALPACFSPWRIR